MELNLGRETLEAAIFRSSYCHEDTGTGKHQFRVLTQACQHENPTTPSPTMALVPRCLRPRSYLGETTAAFATRTVASGHSWVPSCSETQPCSSKGPGSSPSHQQSSTSSGTPESYCKGKHFRSQLHTQVVWNQSLDSLGYCPTYQWTDISSEIFAFYSNRFKNPTPLTIGLAIAPGNGFTHQ